MALLRKALAAHGRQPLHDLLKEPALRREEGRARVHDRLQERLKPTLTSKLEVTLNGLYQIHVSYRWLPVVASYLRITVWVG